MYFATIHLLEVRQIYDNSFSRGQPPIFVTGHWRILSYDLAKTELPMSYKDVWGHRYEINERQTHFFNKCFVMYISYIKQYEEIDIKSSSFFSY